MNDSTWLKDNAISYRQFNAAWTIKTERVYEVNKKTKYICSTVYNANPQLTEATNNLLNT